MTPYKSMPQGACDSIGTLAYLTHDHDNARPDPMLPMAPGNALRRGLIISLRWRAVREVQRCHPRRVAGKKMIMPDLTPFPFGLIAGVACGWMLLAQRQQGAPQVHGATTVELQPPAPLRPAMCRCGDTARTLPAPHPLLGLWGAAAVGWDGPCVAVFPACTVRDALRANVGEALWRAQRWRGDGARSTQDRPPMGAAAGARRPPRPWPSRCGALLMSTRWHMGRCRSGLLVLDSLHLQLGGEGRGPVRSNPCRGSRRYRHCPGR